MITIPGIKIDGIEILIAALILNCDIFWQMCDLQ